MEEVFSVALIMICLHNIKCQKVTYRRPEVVESTESNLSRFSGKEVMLDASVTVKYWKSAEGMKIAAKEP